MENTQYIKPQSFWIESTKKHSFPLLKGKHKTDVLIVGGGITGITTAYLLRKKGVDVTVIEGNTIGSGATGYTTAKITAQHKLIYSELIDIFNIDVAKSYFEANISALKFIKQEVNDKNIACDFSNQSAFVYTQIEEDKSKLEKEMKAYEKLGIKYNFIERIPLPLHSANALAIKEQAQFHPLKYLHFITDICNKSGIQIYEHTRALYFDDEDQNKVITNHGEINAEKIIVATHFPFFNSPGMFYAKMHIDRSYVSAVYKKDLNEKGMFITNGNKVRSARFHPYSKGQLILYGGENHKIGQNLNTKIKYNILSNEITSIYEDSQLMYQWSNQDCITQDKLPYIGLASKQSDNLFVATGYNKWGMTNGTIAGIILSDLVMDKENKYSEIFSPIRGASFEGVKNFVVDGINTAGELIGGKLETVEKKPVSLQNGEAKIVKVKERKVGAYKNSNGEFHIVDNKCTHMGCQLNFNSAEETWDCPCHGSRFSTTGEIIEGPAVDDLEEIDYTD